MFSNPRHISIQQTKVTFLLWILLSNIQNDFLKSFPKHRQLLIPANNLFNVSTAKIYPRKMSRKNTEKVYFPRGTCLLFPSGYSIHPLCLFFSDLYCEYCVQSTQKQISAGRSSSRQLGGFCWWTRYMRNSEASLKNFHSLQSKGIIQLHCP